MAYRKFSVYTLIDITATSIIDNNSDNVKQRNQQRNWETAHQLINLRTQSMVEAVPASPRMIYCEGHEFGSYYRGQHRCWKFIFTIDFDNIFGTDDDPYRLLVTDFNEVPIITGLDETVNLPDPVFYTEGILKNTYFRGLE
jgi:hypothetical protein